MGKTKKDVPAQAPEYSFSDFTRVFLTQETRHFEYKDVVEDIESYVLYGTYYRHVHQPKEDIKPNAPRLLERTFSISFTISDSQIPEERDIVVSGFGESEVCDSTLEAIEGRGGVDVMSALEPEKAQDNGPKYINEYRLWYAAVNTVLANILS